MSLVSIRAAEPHVAERESRTKTRTFTRVHRLCRDWLDKQVAKRAAQEAAKRAQAELGRQAPTKRQRPKARFEAGETAEASVLNMLEAKLLGGRVNRSVVKHLFECGPAVAGWRACCGAVEVAC